MPPMRVSSLLPGPAAQAPILTVDSVPKQNVRDRLQQDGEIQRQRVFPDVLHVQLLSPGPRNAVTAGQLRHSGQARLDAQAQLLLRRIEPKLVRLVRTRPDQ